MMIQFATCNPKRALEFLRKMYPELPNLSWDDLPLTLDALKKDLIRVQDPDYHKPCQVTISGPAVDKPLTAEVKAVVAEMKRVL